MKSLVVFCLAGLVSAAGAQGVPDPLVANDGTKITTAAEWREKRRPELVELFTRERYGRNPGRPEKMTFEVFDRDPAALDGKATRLQIAIYPGGKPGPRMDLLVYVPNGAKGPVPAILGLNFWGNHAIHKDPGIRLTESWVESRTSYADLTGVRDNKATDAARGVNASQWPVEVILPMAMRWPPCIARMWRQITSRISPAGCIRCFLNSRRETTTSAPSVPGHGR